MNCSDCEQLFDAYLDGNLKGSLRLEFDAHRLRCQRCQQTLAMLEAVGDIIANDAQVPDLSDDFTQRVMQEIAPARPRIVLRFPHRLRTVTLIASQAAAILLLVWVWPHLPARQAVTPSPQPQLAANDYRADPEFQMMRAFFVEQVQDRLTDVEAVGTRISNDMQGLASYLNITVPDTYARESYQLVEGNPLNLIFGPPVQSDDKADSEAAPASDDVHSI